MAIFALGKSAFILARDRQEMMRSAVNGHLIMMVWRLRAPLVDLKSLSGMDYETSCKNTIRS